MMVDERVGGVVLGFDSVQVETDGSRGLKPPPAPRTVGLIIVLLLGTVSAMAVERPTVVVTTTMLESAVRELVPAEEAEVLVLAPPGACPGHFDLSPRQLPVLRGADLILRHPFQAGLQAQLEKAGVDPEAIEVVTEEDSLLLPERYLELVASLAGSLGRVAPFPDRVPGRVETVRERLERLEAELRGRADVLRGAAVLASARQRDYCGWLGLDVVGSLGRPEDLHPRELASLMSADPEAVVGNLQEGTRAAESLASRLEVPLAVLSAFPDADGWEDGYDALLRGNLLRLEEALARHVAGPAR